MRGFVVATVNRRRASFAAKMKVYEIHKDTDGWYAGSAVMAGRPWSLPVVICDTCGRTRDFHLEYPGLFLPKGIDPTPYQSGWPVSNERLIELTEPLRKAWGPSLPLGPGTSFGPLRGDARGRHGDFTWLGGLPLISPKALYRLTSSGLTPMATFATEIVCASGKLLPHLEVRPPRRASVGPEGFGPAALNPCPECSRIDLAGSEFEKWGTYKVQMLSVPKDTDIFAVCELGTILVTDRFVDAVVRLRLSNIAFREIQLVDYTIARS